MNVTTDKDTINLFFLVLDSLVPDDFGQSRRWMKVSEDMDWILESDADEHELEVTADIAEEMRKVIERAINGQKVTQAGAKKLLLLWDELEG